MMELPGKGNWEGQKEVYGCADGVTTVEELQRSLDKKHSTKSLCLTFKKPSTRIPTTTFSRSYTLAE